MRDCVGDKRRQLYLALRRHMARMARAAETRGSGRRAREVVLRASIHTARDGVLGIGFERSPASIPNIV